MLLDLAEEPAGVKLQLSPELAVAPLETKAGRREGKGKLPFQRRNSSVSALREKKPSTFDKIKDPKRGSQN